ncbi:hypothetical protein [Paeniglutamicibacter sp.]|uniref:hypothetical protein n=1 Tax=Paeniglutamicibacter sp. TaxID=1934391 RepID=UPI0039892C06
MSIPSWSRLSEENRKKAVDRGGHPFLMSLKSKRAGGADRLEAAASVLTPVEDLNRLAASKNRDISSIAKKTLLALITA